MKGTHRMAMMRNRVAVCVAMVATTAALGGCVTVSAPDKPIVIQLDINIRAEVLYALAEDAKNGTLPAVSWVLPGKLKAAGPFAFSKRFSQSRTWYSA